jgi:opacity protein-like surface antigen
MVESHGDHATKRNSMKNTPRITTGLLVVAAAFTLATGAQAQSATPTYSSMYGAGGAYVDLNLGRSDYSLDNGIGVWNSNQGDTAYSGHIGSYFNDNMGMEIGYTDFGTSSRAGGNTRARGLSLSLEGKFAVMPALNLLGKIGTTYSDTDVSSGLGSGVVAGNATGFGLSYGLGVDYTFTPKWSALLQYESHDMQFAGDTHERIGITTLGVRYHY